ncbi:MAG: DUF305 domain-containing protein [Actinobacteria bacterium]|nr:DUF305 domain-containing protein [Actinomycetota bacterium]
MRRLSSIAVATVLAVLPVACGGDDGGDNAEHGAEHGEPSSAAAFNDSDVAFARGMIPHHAQAVDMADLAEERAAGPEVRDLAERIRDAQQPEIDLMEGWLDDWGHPMDFGYNMDMDDMDMDGMDMEDMGMVSEEDMDRLESASGAEFDRLFLTSMREHHLGAVAMAEEELRSGESPEAKELAQEIIDTQRAEIEEIDALLAA